MADAGELRARATLDNAEFLGALKQLQEQVKTQTEASAAQFEKVSGSVEGMAQALEGIGLAKFLEEFASEALDAGAAIAKLKTQFENLNGPTEETAALFEQLQKMELHSLFDFKDTLGPAAEEMLKLGVSADQVGKTMQTLVDTASGLKEGPSWIQNVSTALAQMDAKGIVSAKNMKALTDNGVNAWQALADKIGSSVPAAMEQVKKGLITGQEVTEAVTDYMEKRWSGAGDATTASWKGAMHLIQVQTDEALEALGASFIQIFNEIKPAITAVGDILKDVVDWFKQLPGPAKDAIIAFGAVLGSITALGPVLAAIAAAASPFLAWAVAIGAVVAALVLLGEWVSNHWAAISAVFEQVWDAVSKFTGLGIIIAAFKDGWKILSDSLSEWLPAIKQNLTDTFGWIPDMFKAIGGGIDYLMQKIPGLSGLAPSNLAKTWKDAQSAQDQYAKGQADVAAAAKASSDAQKTLYAQQDQTAKAAANAALAAAAAEKERAAQAKTAAEAAKKAADEEKKYNDDLLKTYDALKAISPEAAQAFAASMGDIETSATKAQQLLGSAWEKADADTRALIESTLAFGDALKALGLTTETQLAAQVGKASDAYALLAASGKASAVDLSNALDGVVAAQQKVVDNLNKDVKKAYDDGKLTIEDYYQSTVNNAQEALAEVLAANAAGQASSTEVWAARQVLIDATAQQTKQALADTQAAYKAFGLSTKADMDTALAQWDLYAEKVAQTAGAGSFQAIQAQIGALQGQQKVLQANGKDLTDQQLAWLKQLQAQLETLKPAADRLTDAFKALGVTPMSGLKDALNAIASELQTVEDARRKGLATDADVYASQKKLFDQTQTTVDYITQQWTDAHKQGKITALDMYDHAAEEAAKYLIALVNVGDRGPDAIAKITAAAQVLNAAQQKVVDQTAKDLTDAYHYMGTKSQQEMDDLKNKAETDFELIADSADKNSTAVQTAWITKTRAAYEAQIAAGQDLTDAQKGQLDKAQQQLTDHLTLTGSAWKTTYDGVSKTIGTAFDDLATKLATGQGSFSDILKNMFDGLKTAAIDGFLEPFKTAITKLIANELANLVSSLSGIGDSLGGLGGGISSLFKTGGGAAATITPIFKDGVDQTAGAAGGIGSALTGGLSSLTSIFTGVGAISSAISAVTGILQLFGVGQQGQKDRLNQISDATTALAQMFGNPVMGILDIINTSNQLDNINSSLGGWIHDSWVDLLDTLHDVHDSVGGGGWLHDFYANGIGPALDTLVQNSSDLVAGVSNVVTGLQALSVTVTATGATTAEAARALGDQIAKNLTTQLAPAK